MQKQFFFGYKNKTYLLKNIYPTLLFRLTVKFLKNQLQYSLLLASSKLIIIN